VFAPRLAEVADARLVLTFADAPSDRFGRAPRLRDSLRRDARSHLAAVRRRLTPTPRSPQSPTQTQLARYTPSPRSVPPCSPSSDRPATAAAARVAPGTIGERLLPDAPCPVAVMPRDYATSSHNQSHGSASELTEAADAPPTRCRCRAARARRGGRAPGDPRLPAGGAFRRPSARPRPGGGGASQLAGAPALLPPSLPARAVFAEGAPAGLADYSRELNLLVVGSRGRVPRARGLGGVSGRVIRRPPALSSWCHAASAPGQARRAGLRRGRDQNRGRDAATRPGITRGWSTRPASRWRWRRGHPDLRGCS
jgi:hypothetical protein